MSGGHWDYKQFNLDAILKEVGTDRDVILRFPKLAQVFYDLASALNNIMHNLDWNLSGDTEIKNDKKFEDDAITKIRSITNRK